MNNFKTFTKFVNGDECRATPIYNGYYDNDIFLMSFKDKFWFDLEVRGIGMLSHKSYSPEILTVNANTMEISFKWYNSNLNHLFHYKKDLPNNWREQISSILQDIKSCGIFKINLYPHTFYLKEDKIHIMDLHACLFYNDQIYEDSLKDVINNKDRFAFKHGILDINYSYNYTIENNIGNWPGGKLNG